MRKCKYAHHLTVEYLAYPHKFRHYIKEIIKVFNCPKKPVVFEFWFFVTISFTIHIPSKALQQCRVLSLKMLKDKSHKLILSKLYDWYLP